MKLLFLLAILSFTAIVQSQVKVDGIYKFYPLVTKIDVIDELSADLKTKVRNVSSYDGLYEAKNGRKAVILNVILMEQDGTRKKGKDFDIDAIEAPQTNEGKVYFISKLDVGGVKVNNIFLYFLHDTLFKFSCDRSDELENAMSVKFGEPVKVFHRNPLLA